MILLYKSLEFQILAVAFLILRRVYIDSAVEVADTAVLGGVAEVVSSIPTASHKNIFQHLPA